MNGAPFTVIGVAPRGFLGTQRGLSPDLWLGLSASGADPASRTVHRLVGLGRLRPGVAAQAAEAEMAVIARRLDPGVFAGASLLLAATGSVAAYLPARRALAVDPMAALRCE